MHIFATLVTSISCLLAIVSAIPLPSSLDSPDDVILFRRAHHGSSTPGLNPGAAAFVPAAHHPAPQHPAPQTLPHPVPPHPPHDWHPTEPSHHLNAQVHANRHAQGARPSKILHAFNHPAGGVVHITPWGFANHIASRHEADFLADHGVERHEIAHHIEKAVTTGKVVGYSGLGSGKTPRPIYAFHHNGQVHHMAVQHDASGEIFGAHPVNAHDLPTKMQQTFAHGFHYDHNGDLDHPSWH